MARDAYLNCKKCGESRILERGSSGKYKRCQACVRNRVNKTNELRRLRNSRIDYKQFDLDNNINPTTQTKRCICCDFTKTLVFFNSNPDTSDKRHTYCKSCIKSKINAANIKDSETNVKRSTLSYYQRSFSVTAVEYRKMSSNQNNKCAICSSSFENTVPHLDHNHSTNKVRGILCYRCNHLLGNANDSITILNSAIKYLEKET